MTDTQITTAAELDALPVGSVVLDPHSRAFQKRPAFGPEGSAWFASASIEGHQMCACPATVLFRPDAPQPGTDPALHLAMSTLTRTLDDIGSILGEDAKACEIGGEIDPDLMWETLAGGYVPLSQREGRPVATSAPAARGQV